MNQPGTQYTDEERKKQYPQITSSSSSPPLSLVKEKRQSSLSYRKRNPPFFPTAEPPRAGQMGVLLHRCRRLSAALAFFLLAAALGSTLASIAEQAGDARLRPSERETRERVMATRRRLGGPGSWPPSCRARCGRCFPCRPVHVAIQPSRVVPLEYYPEAWRCECGNKLFMP